ncbi:hypothetical protein [Sorangium sp. So ce388]
MGAASFAGAFSDVSPALGDVLPGGVALVFPWEELPGSCDDGFVGCVEP